MYSVKLDSEMNVVSCDHINLIQHSQLGRTDGGGWRFVDRQHFRNEDEFNKFVLEPTRHYFDKNGVIRRMRI